MIEFGTINPRECRGEKTEVKMVLNGQLLSALGVECADFVLDFLKSAFDFPSCGVVFDHLFRHQFKDDRKKRKREVAVINKDNTYFVSQSSGETAKLGKMNQSSFSIKMNRSAFDLIFELRRDFTDVWKSLPIFPFPSPFRRHVIWEVEETRGNAQSGEKFNFLRNMFANFFQKRQRTEPAVANNQNGIIEKPGELDHERCTDSGFGIEPLRIWEFCGGFDFLKQRHIEFLSERQTSPASVNKLQNTHNHATMSGNELGRVGFCCMVKMPCTSENVFSGIAVNCVIKCDQQTSGNLWIVQHTNEKHPERIPWDFSGIDEIIESLECAASGDDFGEFTEYTADSAGLSAGDQCDHDGSENNLAVDGDNCGCLIKQVQKLHGRLLSFESIGNIAQTTFESHFLHVDNQGVAT